MQQQIPSPYPHVPSSLSPHYSSPTTSSTNTTIPIDNNMLQSLMPIIEKQVDQKITEITHNNVLQTGGTYFGVAPGMARESPMMVNNQFEMNRNVNVNMNMNANLNNVNFLNENAMMSPRQSGFQFTAPTSVRGWPSYADYIPPKTVCDDPKKEGLRKYREKREKRRYGRAVNEERSKMAQSRSRDEKGLFVSTPKKVKTIRNGSYVNVFNQ